MIAPLSFGVLTLILSSPLAVVAGCPRGSPNGAYCTLTNYWGKDWMARYPDSRNIATMSLPGTHDTLAIKGGDLTQCQENYGASANTLTAQLNAGIRALDIRLRITDGNKFTIHHGPEYQDANFDDVLTKLRDFLGSNNRETVLLRLKRECTGELFSCKDASGDFQGILRQYVRDYGNLFWSPTAGSETWNIPNLGEVRGKAVIMVVHDKHGARASGWGFSHFNGWNDGNSEFVQDDYNVPNINAIATKRDRVRRFLDKTSSGDRGRIYVNFGSGSSAFAHPWSVAAGMSGVQGVNPFLNIYLREPETVHPKVVRTGVVFLDFPGADLIGQIIETNNLLS